MYTGKYMRLKVSTRHAVFLFFAFYEVQTGRGALSVTENPMSKCSWPDIN